MTNIQFPKTNIVGCVFAYRGAGNLSTYDFDEFDRATNVARLKVYYYRVPEHLQDQLKVGDTVVVHCQTGYQICEIRELNALFDDDKDRAPVVCKVDLSSWIESVKKKQKLIYLKKELDKEMKRLQSQVTYELIAEKYPEFKELLDTYKAEGGQF